MDFQRISEGSRGRARVLLPAVGLALVIAGPAGAQSPDVVGVRAQGMAGAFVALADDASAVYWNPAALAKGAIFSAVIEGVDRRDNPSGPPAGPAASRRSAALVAIGAPALGVAYYRTRLVRVPAGVTAGSSRNEGRTGAVGPSSLTVHTLGVSVLQSLGDALVVGATLKWERGLAAAAPEVAGGTAGERLDAASALRTRATSTFDVDVGVLAAVGPVRAGLVAHNLRAPAFSTPDGETLDLERRVRAGLALRATSRLTLAADADLTRTTDADGARRRGVSLGAEGRVAARVLLRAGVGLTASGPSRSSASVGVSVALSRVWWLDGELTRGAAGARGWGLSARVDY